ncbi:MAG: hypothetical protein Q7S77_00620 [Candidatus Staskawiczbacteria bacterium]|nr:hypothetical protein [Candidatus Staskawiczbacteria bacterium]
MIISFKKNIWTQHSQLKIKQYGLSKNKLLGILSKPERKELGIVPDTIAVMRTNKISPSSKSVSWRKKNPGEIWMMYKDSKSERKIISCWRYPGISKPGEEIPIPDDIKQEIIKGKLK